MCLDAKNRQTLFCQNPNLSLLMQLMAAIFDPFVGLINQAKTPSHSQANKLYGNPRKVLKFTYTIMIKHTHQPKIRES